MPVTSSAIGARRSAQTALRGQAGGADFEHPAGLEHLVAREAVQGGQEAERARAEPRRAAGDEGARALPRLGDAHGRQRVQPGAHRGTADAELLGQVPLRGQTVAGAERAASR